MSTLQENDNKMVKWIAIAFVIAAAIGIIALISNGGIHG